MEKRFSVEHIYNLLGNHSYEDFAFRNGYAYILTRQAGEIIIEAPDNQIPGQTRALIRDVLTHLDECKEKAYRWLKKFRGPEFAKGFRLCGIYFGHYLHHNSSYTTDGFTMMFKPNAPSPYQYTVKFFSNRHPIEAEEWAAIGDASPESASEAAESRTQAKPVKTEAQTLPPWDFTPHSEAEVTAFLKDGKMKSFRYGDGEFLIDCHKAGELCIQSPDGRIPDETKSLIYDVLDHLDECIEKAQAWLEHCCINEALRIFDCEYELGGFDFGKIRFGHNPVSLTNGFSVWFSSTDYDPLGFTVKFTRDRQPFAIEQWIG